MLKKVIRIGLEQFKTFKIKSCFLALFLSVCTSFVYSTEVFAGADKIQNDSNSLSWEKIAITAGVSALTLATVVTGFWLSLPFSPQIFGEKFNSIKTNEKIVALTFDDGPIPDFTNKILEVLSENEIKATFFVMGERAEKNPDLIKKMYLNGHEIGNHTWEHKMMIFKSYDFIKEQIEKTDKILRDFGYEKEIYFRSPYGMKFLVLSWILSKMQKKNILFDVVSWDFNSPETEKIVKNVMTSVKPGSIILMHDGCGDMTQTVSASRIIISKLKDLGYKFLTVSELLAFQEQNLNEVQGKNIQAGA